MVAVRHARPEDASAIAAIWNPMILGTLSTFAAAEKTEQDVAALIGARGEAGHVWLVAEAAGEMLGFAAYAQFRSGAGYARTMEHSIILRPASVRRGTGRRLIGALEDAARARRVHALIGAISAENAAGLGFHAAMGFAEVGRLAQVGHKLGRWLDLVLVQKLL
ncbi:GNAT family N-acetyltransferase [soil metagenome]